MKEYENEKLSCEIRAKALLSEMSLDEKIRQICSDMIRETDGKDLRDFNKGHSRSCAHFMHWDFDKKQLFPKKTSECVQAMNEDIDRSMRESEHKIPVLVHDEALHGAQWGMATCFPQPIALASSFDDELIEKVADTIGKESRVAGVRQVLSPVVNVCRDSRWGRTMETFGEDVLLNCNFGVAMCKGFEKNGVIATPKHFVDNYGPGGRDSNESNTSERVLREVYYKPFERCVKEGGAKSIMTAYNSLDGVPCACNGKLLNDLLRGEWGFDGFVVSDYGGVGGISYRHKLTSEEYISQAYAMNNGHDVTLPRLSPETVKRAMDEGYLTEETLNESVLRVLTQKFRLGLMDEPFSSPDEAERLVRNEQAKALAYEVAKECLVLLKNDNVLPVSAQKTKKIAVFGQSANVVPIGENYSGPFGGWKADDALTPLQALTEYCGDRVEIVFGNEENAENLCKTCDLAIYFTSTVEGEGMDRCDIRLPNVTRKTQQDEGAIIVDKRTVEIEENQEEIILKIAKNSPKSVVILLNGAPVDMSAWVDEVGAVVEAWYPGEQGARAIVETLFGEFSPSGKLPITFARSVGQLPLYYAHTPSGRGYGYNENDGSPLYPFGYGLSYTRFVVSESKIKTDGKDLRVEGEIENIGQMDGAEVLQVYISGRNCDVVRPVKQLAGYKRVKVNRGEKIRFDIHLDKESFHFYNSAMAYGRHDCDYTVLLATSSQNTLKEFEIRLRDGKVKIANEW